MKPDLVQVLKCPAQWLRNYDHLTKTEWRSPLLLHVNVFHHIKYAHKFAKSLRKSRTVQQNLIAKSSEIQKYFLHIRRKSNLCWFFVSPNTDVSHLSDSHDELFFKTTSIGLAVMAQLPEILWLLFVMSLVDISFIYFTFLVIVKKFQIVRYHLDEVIITNNVFKLVLDNIVSVVYKKRFHYKCICRIVSF